MMAGRPLPSPWLWFGPWAVVGAGGCLSLLAMFSIGPTLAVGTLGFAAFVAVASKGRGIMGVVSGLAAPLLFVAYNNRNGPGMICSTTAYSESCGQEWSPWPWLTAAVFLLLAGVVILVQTQRSEGRTQRTWTGSPQPPDQM